jgi:Ca-activated chloride channel family protein
MQQLAAGLTLAAMACAGCGDDSHTGYGYEHVGPPPSQQGEPSGEKYEEWTENDFVDASTENTSTFSIDVDNASYTLMRRDLESGSRPAPESVRVEEYINFFDYDYPQPTEHPFSIDLEVAPSRFGADKHLVRVGLQGEEIAIEDMKPTNLVFLVDVSGSMKSQEKLPMVKRSLYTLLDHLRPSDRVGIVVYAGSDGVVLDSTEVRDRDAIEDAIENLVAGGSTNAEAGIVTAYEMAESVKKENGNNRVIILTDGDFNVGKTGDELVDFIASYRQKHISLTCVGYGRGNYNDYNMEGLAREGNGNYFYVDTLEEAERIFGTKLPSTLEVIASDVKVQVEFDTSAVSRYRLVGYENRLLDNEDFEDDSVDAGEIGPGHTVTAFYEVELADGAAREALLAEVRLRYKNQYGESSDEVTRSIKIAGIAESFEAASTDFRFAAAVVEFAEILRDSVHVETPDLDAVRSLAASTTQGRPEREELVDLIDRAISSP